MKTAKCISIGLAVAIIVSTVTLSASAAYAAEPNEYSLNALKNISSKSTSNTKTNVAIDQSTKQSATLNQLMALTNQELIVNGDLEASPTGHGWNDPYGDIGYWTYSYSGVKSAYIGYTLNSWDLIYQNTTIPFNSVSATASFRWRLYSLETLSGYDSVQFRVLNANDFSVAYCDFYLDPTSYSQGTWYQSTCDFSAARGEEVVVVVGVSNDSSLSTWVYADDVSVVAHMDETPPTTTATINPPSPNGLNGWYSTPPTMTLSADDGVDGLGVWGTLYRIGDPLGDWDLYSAPVQLPDGNYSSYYASIDYGFNLEDDKSFSIKVDSTKPLISLTGTSNIRVVRNGTFSDPGAIATDVLDPSVLVIPSGIVNTAILGDYLITYNATDQAGNNALPVTRTVSVVEPSDLTALTSAILAAQTIYNSSVEGSIPGQHTIGSKAILQSAINTAQSITTAYSQTDVDAAIATLNSAVATFNTSIVPPSNLSSLSAAIASAQTTYNNSVEGTAPGQYPAPLKANLLSAINSALAITSAQAQSAVDAAIAPLNSAIATFLAGVVPTPPPAPPAPVVTPPAPIPQVLGTTTTRPIIKGLTVIKGVFSFKLNGVTKKIYPYGKTYKGTVWGKSVDFGSDGKLFVFVNSQEYPKGQIRVYRSDGKLLKAYNPYGGFATNGLNATAVVESNDNVYLAVATTKSGTTVKTYQLTAKGLTTLNSLKATKSAGNLKVAFKKLYKTQYGLVTMKEGDRSTLKVWKLNLTTNKFVEDKKINKSKITI